MSKCSNVDMPQMFNTYLMNMYFPAKRNHDKILSKTQPRNPPSQAHTSFRLNVTTINRPPSCKDSKAVVKVKRNSESSSNHSKAKFNTYFLFVKEHDLPVDPTFLKTIIHRGKGYYAF